MEVKAINGYVNYGDVNIEHGALFLRDNREREAVEFYKVFAVDDLEGDEVFYLGSGEVDDDEPWIDWKGVKDSCDTDLTDRISKARDAISYYAIENFGSYDLQKVTLEEVVERLKKWEIIE